MKFMVETRFGYGWQNCWSEDDKPVYFNSIAEAEQDAPIATVANEQVGMFEDKIKVYVILNDDIFLWI